LDFEKKILNLNKNFLKSDHNIGPCSFPDDVEKSGISGTLVAGIIAGVLLIVALVALFLFARHRQQVNKTFLFLFSLSVYTLARFEA
jgi:hypothetical protein